MNSITRRAACLMLGTLLFLTALHSASAADGNRFTYLDENDPYSVSRTFPRLITPQWVGEEGVEAVIVLAIDDMRAPEKYEAFLRPILVRLKQIDGRAPVSIMTCRVDLDVPKTPVPKTRNSKTPETQPQLPQLQAWLADGLSLEIHTYDHPCPLLQGNDFAKAKETYDRCVDLLHEVPGSRPVAFRMPCCDSLNTLSPRFFKEIFNKTTSRGNFLALDSSVFNVCTSNDPDIPRALVIDADGRDKFRKYVPHDRSFVNTIEDYPYPYLINRLCWEFPCGAPSDWSAQHLQKPNNPDTVRDLKAALDISVLKQGVFNLVFHPHGWIRNDQVVDLIDHAVRAHGKKVKFLTFKEAHERLNTHLLAGQSVRDSTGGDNGVRLLDLNRDGFMDVLIGNPHLQSTRLWSNSDRTWKTAEFPARFAEPAGSAVPEARFGVVRADGLPSVVITNRLAAKPAALHFDGAKWIPDGLLLALFDSENSLIGARPQLRLRDIDADGRCELITSYDGGTIYAFGETAGTHRKLPLKLPVGTLLASPQPTGTTDRAGPAFDAGLRFFDLDEDGRDDIVFSNERRSAVHLFESLEKGWSREALSRERGKQESKDDLPMIARNGTDNGAWFHSRHLWVQNEDTAKMKDLVDRRSISDMLGDVEPGPKTPAAGLASLVPRPGFEVELVAAEPLTMDPVAFDWGPDGKFWVVEMADYPLGIDGQGKPGGRVRFLEDTDGDGPYDKSTLFLEDVPYPTAVLAWRKGVLVTAAPDIFYAEDTNGDGRADRREVLFTGFSEGNQQHRVNGLVWGLDNWIYCANGDSGGTIKSLKSGETIDFHGRDLRIRPGDGRMEAQSGLSQFGRNRDDWDNWFGNNNSNPMYQFVIPDQYLRRNPHYPAGDMRVNISVAPGAAPVFPISRTRARFNDLHTANRFTSACSAMIYRDDLFGPHFTNNSFVSEPVHNLVHREVLNPKGATFSSQRPIDEQKSEFLASSDNWFRPTMIRTGPDDGALWVADMYRHVIEHPQWIPADWQKRLDLRAGHDKGRIYRVAPVGVPRRPIPRLDALDTPRLVAALDSPSGWQRDSVQQLLIERQDKRGALLLADLAAGHPRPESRLHALCTLDGLQSLTVPVLLRALSDTHPGVRRHAVRLCEPETFRQVPEVIDALLERIDDTDPQLRLQLACTLGELADPRAGAALGKMLLAHGNDRFVFAAVMSSMTAANIDALLEVVLADTTQGSPNLNLIENLLGLAAAFGNDNAIANLLTRAAVTEGGKYGVSQYGAIAALLDALDRRQTPLSKLKPAAKDSLDQVFAAARKTASDASAAEPDRVAAVRLLGRGPGGQEADAAVLASFLTPQSSGELQQAALAALGRTRGVLAPQFVVERWKGFGPALRPVALDLLLGREEGRDRLLSAMEQGAISPLDIDAARRQRLLDDKSQANRTRAAKLFAAAADGDRQKLLARYRPALAAASDAVRGAPLFAKTCAQCHKLAGSGFEVGPDLAALSDKSPESLLVAILDPNRAVESKFVNYTAVTKAGQTLNGLLAVETGNSITLRGPEAKDHVLLRSDLEELVSSSKSTMPEGLEKDLQPQDVADLIAYIRSNVPLPKRKEFAANNPALVRPAADGSFTLTPATCEIYGPSIVFEDKYGNLGFWASPEDSAAWSMDVPRSGPYYVDFEWACPDNSAGNLWKLDVASSSLTGKVVGTKTWDIYHQARMGAIRLEAGKQRLTIRSAGPINGALFDLKSVRVYMVK